MHAHGHRLRRLEDIGGHQSTVFREGEGEVAATSVRST
jgi:hypothetical protein